MFCEHCLREEPRGVYDLYPSELTALVVGAIVILVGGPALAFFGGCKLIQLLAGFTA